MLNEPSWIYLAAPLFTQAEQEFNAKLAQQLQSAGHTVFLPQEEAKNLTKTEDIFKRCLYGLDRAHLVLAILDGSDADSGTCFEVGYAYAKKLPVIGLRTDFRGTGDDWGLNLMLLQSCNHLLLAKQNLPKTIPSNITMIAPGEDYFPILQKILE
ncbi:nucleoside 2-deoxyribosyltransferase [Roseofilum sp. BLCC_M91]|uniref:Nucleoside 2-deoxyribosyltransferase n=1 Tax=Roseofilum halophilum BLCC-M91 TaxID=3022259 RepID=A0ABT7BQ56_9CYAN|nr:nucleoside 2-deoxyribosyltransferase [Roseofilum halophilum]MDJ1180664.1 nucleoside 2-deoxyribosyltransferase [Roseofilum halophilum BLCC-M91]